MSQTKRSAGGKAKPSAGGQAKRAGGAQTKLSGKAQAKSSGRAQSEFLGGALAKPLHGTQSKPWGGIKLFGAQGKPSGRAKSMASGSDGSNVTSGTHVEDQIGAESDASSRPEEDKIDKAEPRGLDELVEEQRCSLAIDPNIWVCEMYSAVEVAPGSDFFIPGPDYVALEEPEPLSPAAALAAKRPLAFLSGLNWQPYFQGILSHLDLVSFDFLLPFLLPFANG